MDDRLCDTFVTGKIIEGHLLNYFKLSSKDAHLTNVDAQIMGEEGYTSKLFRAALTWHRDNAKNIENLILPKSVIVKAPTAEALTRLMEKLKGHQEGDEKSISDQLDQDTLLEQFYLSHNDECMVYAIFRDNPNVVPIPVCYAGVHQTSDQPGLIILEDLSDRASVIKDVTHLFDLDTELYLASILADLHGWSVSTDYPWREKIGTLDAPDRRIRFSSLLKPVASGLCHAKKSFPQYFAEIDAEKVVEFMTVDNVTKQINVYEGIMPTVLVHGDFHALNLMFKKLPQDKVDTRNLVAFIDWQLAHQGSGMVDLARLIAFKMSVENRRRHTDEILRKYYEIFKLRGGEKVKNLTFEQLKSMYEQVTPFVAVFFVGFIPLLMDILGKSGLTEERLENVKKTFLERAAAFYNDSKQYLK